MLNVVKKSISRRDIKHILDAKKSLKDLQELYRKAYKLYN